MNISVTQGPTGTQPIARGSNPRRRASPGSRSLIGLLLLCSWAAVSQPDPVIYTVGTTAHAGNQEWAYVTWKATDSDLLRGRIFAVYAKPGGPAAAGPYTRSGVVALQTDPGAIAVLLQRSRNVGEILPDLESALDATFQQLTLGTSLDVAGKLSLVIRGSLTQPAHYDNLLLLAQMHPGVSLCLGLAHTLPTPAAGQTTIEIRQVDPTNHQDLAVAGRVTVTAGVPLVLPAPGRPFQIPEANPKADLNIKLRWATPLPLRQLAMLQYGYNVYRLPQAVVLANNYQNSPPAISALLNLAAGGLAVRVNELPLLPSKLFDTDAQAVNVDLNTGGDPDTYFLSDDRRREPGSAGIPFDDGEQFYYFVTARDVLGRDGLVSPGGLAMACDRLPPPAPSRLQVANDYSYVSPPAGAAVTNQWLRLTWRQLPNTNAGDAATAYYIYRWGKASDPLTLGNDPTVNRVAGPIPHLNGQAELSYLDNGTGPFTLQPASPPAMPQDAGRTYWYTVRAVSSRACTNTFSPHSEPAYGVLRDRVGPAPVDLGSARVGIQCSVPQASYGFALPLAWPQPDLDLVAFQVACARTGPGAETLAWAEFHALEYLVGSPGLPFSNFIARTYFPSAFAPGDFANAAFYIPRSDAREQSVVQFGCRVGTTGGRVSDLALGAITGATFPATNQFLAVAFSASLVVTPSQDCGYHEPAQPGTNKVAGIDLTFTTTPTTREYKIFRRVGQGPLTLIKQGTTTTENPQQITYEDTALPAVSTEVCYFVQLFDTHGNPGPLTLLQCVPCAGSAPLPKPLLVAIEPSGVPATPTMKIAWVCPPYGVDRFRVHVATDGGEPSENSAHEFAANLSANILSGPSSQIEVFKTDGAQRTNQFKVYRTPPAGAEFGNGAEFALEAKVQLNRKYFVTVQAVGKADANELGPASEAQSFTWHAVKPPGPVVPWPARPLPQISSFDPGILARAMPTTAFLGLGVRIGEVKCSNRGTAFGSGRLCIPPADDPAKWVYRDTNLVSLFPLVLYRYQVANVFFPASGDVVQVSPMMESIAYALETDPFPNGAIGLVTHIYDPFIRLVPVPALPEQNPTHWDLYLVDTQPVVINATYRYVLVRFDPRTKEPVQVIPTNPVTALPP